MENLLEGRLLGLHEEIDLVAGTRYAYIGVGRDDFNAHPGSATCRFASSRLKDASSLPTTMP